MAGILVAERDRGRRLLQLSHEIRVSKCFYGFFKTCQVVRAEHDSYLPAVSGYYDSIVVALNPFQYLGQVVPDLRNWHQLAHARIVANFGISTSRIGIGWRSHQTRSNAPRSDPRQGATCTC